MVHSFFLLIVAVCVSVTFSFVTPSILCRSIRSSLMMKMPDKIANKDEKGMMDRFDAMAATKRKAAAALKGTNKELAAELDEMADEMKETAEAFVKAASAHNAAASRPSPVAPTELRLLKYKNMAAVKRIAAKQLKSTNQELATQLEELADEIDASHARFEELTWDIVGDTGVAKGIE